MDLTWLSASSIWQGLLEAVDRDTIRKATKNKAMWE